MEILIKCKLNGIILLFAPVMSKLIKSINIKSNKKLQTVNKDFFNNFLKARLISLKQSCSFELKN